MTQRLLTRPPGAVLRGRLPTGRFALLPGGAALLLVIGGLVTETAFWGRRTDAALSKEVGYVDGVLATSESASANASGPEEQARQVSQRTCEVLTWTVVTSSWEWVGPPAPTLQQDGGVTRAGRDVDVNRDGLPVDSVVVLPVRSAGELRARFLLTAASHVARPNERQRRVAVLLADQIGPTRNGQSARDAWLGCNRRARPASVRLPLRRWFSWQRAGVLPAARRERDVRHCSLLTGQPTLECMTDELLPDGVHRLRPRADPPGRGGPPRRGDANGSVLAVDSVLPRTGVE